MPVVHHMAFSVGQSLLSNNSLGFAGVSFRRGPPSRRQGLPLTQGLLIDKGLKSSHLNQLGLVWFGTVYIYSMYIVREPVNLTTLRL